MKDIAELYFKKPEAWRQWLHENHDKETGVYLIFYLLANEEESMRWEEAVKVALCYGWIDSTVKSLGNGKRRQYFCPRKPKSVWSKLNKDYIRELKQAGLMHQSGLDSVALAKRNGSWTALDQVEAGIMPEDLRLAFEKHPEALANYEKFSFSYRKGYLYWLNQAKREATRQARIKQIVSLCAANKKSRS